MATRSASRAVVSTAPTPPRRQDVSHGLFLTPQPYTTRITRRTRSQSRDLHDRDVASSRTRRRRTTSEISDSEPSERIQRTRGKDRLASELPALQEESLFVDDGNYYEASDQGASLPQPNDSTEMDSVPMNDFLLSQHAEDRSHIADVDVDTMIQDLPDLYKHSKNYLETLLPRNKPITAEAVIRILEDAHARGSALARKLEQSGRKLEAFKSNYTRRDYISPTLILEKLFNTDEPEAADCRPDAVLYLANMVALLANLIFRPDNDVDLADMLQKLDRSFPYFFLANYESRAQHGSSSLLQETFDLALEIRTHAVLATLKAQSQEPDFDPEGLIAGFFFEGSDADIPLDDHLSKSPWQYLANMDRTPASRAFFQHASGKLTRRVVELQESIRRRGAGRTLSFRVDFDLLDEQFNWTSFFTVAAEWCKARRSELLKNIFEQGDIDALVESLEQEVKGRGRDGRLAIPRTNKERRRRSDGDALVRRRLGKLRSSEPLSSPLGRSFYTGARAARLVSRLEHQASPEQDELDTSLDIEPEVDTTPISGPIATGAEPSSSIPPPSNRNNDEIWAVLQRAGRDETKENRPLETREPTSSAVNQSNTDQGTSHPRRFLDKQTGATRVTFTQESPQTNQVVASQKRPRTTVEASDESEDDGFEADRRPSKRARAPPRPDANQQVATDDNDFSLPNLDNDDVPANADEQHTGQGGAPADNEEVEIRINVADIPNPRQNIRRPRESSGGPPRYVGSQHDQLQSIVRPSMRMDPLQYVDYRAAPPDPPRRLGPGDLQSEKAHARARKAWTTQESANLIALIVEHGCSWATIERIGKANGYFQGRNQVALKDKARNMKIEFLQRGLPLPDNFDDVTMKSADEDKLRKREINPYRLVGELPGSETRVAEDGSIRQPRPPGNPET